MNKILVINAGSSTIKWKLFNEENLGVLAEGVADRIMVDGVISTKFNGQKFERKVELNSHMKAAKEILSDLIEHKIVEDLSLIKCVGNRVVQGGDIFEKSVVVKEEELKQIEELGVLAPLHNPGAVEAIKAFQDALPHAKFTATFDTSFHTSIPKINHTYPINSELVRKHKIKKYGAHGTSHRYITTALEKILNKDKVTFINMHIGNGASLCAVKDSLSYDTSMGLTPLAGIMMGTRSGDIDPSIHKYVIEQEKITIQEFDRILNKESGLKGVSGISQDMRDLTEELNNGNEDAKFTIKLYASKIVNYLAMYFNKLNAKIDALVFTAGVGENSNIVREKVIEEFKLTNAKIDKQKNLESFGSHILISTPDSLIPIYVIRTDEELLIAQDAKDL